MCIFKRLSGRTSVQGRFKPTTERIKSRKKRNNRILRPNDVYLISFLVPVFIMVLIFEAKGIFPFGEESFLRTDMYHQYAPFFSEFQYKLKHGGSLLYSWDVGMGVNFSALYAYYLASPLNWLILLCPKAYILEFMTGMIVVKMGFCSTAMTWYLRNHYRTRDFGCVFFGIFYAMSGYIAAYSWNIMWMDCIFLFPILTLGMEKLMKGGRPYLYILSLGLSILSNYYISIMTCIFLVLYFFALEMIEGEKDVLGFVRKGLRFAGASLLAGALAAVTLIPEIFALQSTASGEFSFPKTYTQYFSIFDMIARHMPNVESETGLDHWPNIYCGVAVFMLFILFLLCKKIRAREKVVYVTLLVIFFASFSINVLNFIWHGFHYPNSLPCRQSFIYIFLVLSLSYHAYRYKKSFTLSQITLAFAISMGFVLMAQKLITDDSFHFSVFYLSMFYLALYYALFYLWKKDRLGYNVLTFAVLFLVIVESAVNMAVISVTTTSRTAYISDNQDVIQLHAQAEEHNREVNEGRDGFYRMEKVDGKTKDDGAWMNFPSVSLFSSTAYAHCSDFFKLVGCEASTNAYSINGSTPLIDMLFAVRYAMYPSLQENSDQRAMHYLGQSGEMYLYENQYTLPAGIVLGRDELSKWLLDLGNPALVQDSFAEAVGAEPVMREVLGTPFGESYDFVAPVTGEYYVYVSNPSVKEVTVNYPVDARSFDNVNRGYFLELGTINEGESINLRSDTSGADMECAVYYFDYASLKQIYDILMEEAWEIETWNDTFLSGNVTAAKSGVLMTSIPYDKGWSAYVDGKEVETEKTADCFVGIPVSAGVHRVEMRYFPQGLKAGAGITGMAGLILGFMVVMEVRKKKKVAIQEETEHV